MMQGIHWVIRNGDQQKNLMQFLFNARFPFQVKVEPIACPKSSRQVRYAHSLCNALAAAKGASPDDAKRDAKAAFGVVIVSTSLVTGDRTVRLKSFADYTRDEMEAFCTAMEVYLSDEGIEFHASA